MPTALPPRRPRTLRAALVFGPDAGLVQERAEKLMKSVVPDLNDRLQCRGSERSGAGMPIRRGWRMKPPPFP